MKQALINIITQRIECIKTELHAINPHDSILTNVDMDNLVTEIMFKIHYLASEKIISVEEEKILIDNWYSAYNTIDYIVLCNGLLFNLQEKKCKNKK